MSKIQDIKALRSGDSIILHYKGEVLNIQKSSRPADFKRVEKLIESGDIDSLVEAFIDIKGAIEKYTKDKMTVDAGVLFDKATGEQIPTAIAKKLIEFKNKNADFLPLWRFWQKLKKNPSANSKAQLYTFVERNKIPITELGDLVMEKGVYMKEDGSLWDDYSKTIDNSIGMVVEMPRNKVTDDPKQGCASGLHVAAPEYVKQHYSQSIIVECIVNPMHVGSVPEDCDFTKMRVERYQVIGLAKKSSKQELVIKMDDFVMLPKMDERREHGFNEVPMNTATDLMKLTAKKIISYVRKETGKRITLDPKNKVSIAKRAEEILQAAGKSEFANSKSTKTKEVVVTEKKCAEIIAMIKQEFPEIDMDSLAGNDPRRGKVIAKLLPILKGKGVQMVD